MIQFDWISIINLATCGKLTVDDRELLGLLFHPAKLRREKSFEQSF